MKKSQLIKIIKEEVTKALQEKTTQSIDNLSVQDKDFVNIGVPNNLAPKVIQAFNKFRKPKGTISDVPLSNEDNKALASVVKALLTTDDATKLNAILNKFKAAKTNTKDIPGQ